MAICHTFLEMVISFWQIPITNSGNWPSISPFINLPYVCVNPFGWPFDNCWSPNINQDGLGAVLLLLQTHPDGLGAVTTLVRWVSRPDDECLQPTLLCSQPIRLCQIYVRMDLCNRMPIWHLVVVQELPGCLLRNLRMLHGCLAVTNEASG